MREITDEKLASYHEITSRALTVAKQAPIADASAAEEIFDMVSRYLSDATYFASKDDYVRAYAAINYAHGWLDCGARLKVYTVTDNTLFTEDGS